MQFFGGKMRNNKDEGQFNHSDEFLVTRPFQIFEECIFKLPSTIPHLVMLVVCSVVFYQLIFIALTAMGLPDAAKYLVYAGAYFVSTTLISIMDMSKKYGTKPDLVRAVLAGLGTTPLWATLSLLGVSGECPTTALFLCFM